MRQAPLLLGAIMILALNVQAQVNPNYSLPEVSLVQDAATPAVSPSVPGTALFASATTSIADEAPTFAGADPGAVSSGNAERQEVSPVGVFQNYILQFYGDYSFFRFYVASKPSLTENMNGLDFGIVYYPGPTWIGVETQFAAEFGSLLAHDSKYGMALGGARFRSSAPRQAQVWGHALVGYTKFIPQTALGGQNAFVFEVGGGVDIGSHRSRIAIRVEGDLVGTRYFSTYQYGPRIAAGLVYNYK
jgi:hypothetical protein